MSELLQNEVDELTVAKNSLFESIVRTITPTEIDNISDIILEVHAGAGGLEAGLFAYDLYSMYQRFVLYYPINR